MVVAALSRRTQYRVGWTGCASRQPCNASILASTWLGSGAVRVDGRWFNIGGCLLRLLVEADETGSETGRAIGRPAASRCEILRLAPLLQAPLDPGREVGQLAPVGVLDDPRHCDGLVVDDRQPVADESASRALGPPGVGADQLDAAGQQLPAKPSGILAVGRASGARLPGIAGRPVRVGTGVWEGVKGWRCRRRGRTIRGRDRG
ncbi:hypothetical protein ACRAWG_31455 [Methylobacterium sp. P31]